MIGTITYISIGLCIYPMSLTGLGTIVVRVYMLVGTSDGTSPIPATIPIEGLPFWTYAIGDC